MKILLVKHNLNVGGGAEYFTISVIRALKELGHKVYLLTDIVPSTQRIRHLFGIEIVPDAIIVPRTIELIKKLPRSMYRDRLIWLTLGLATRDLTRNHQFNLVFFTHCDSPYVIFPYNTNVHAICYIHYPYVFRLRNLVIEAHRKPIKAIAHLPLSIADPCISYIAIKRHHNITVLCNSRFTAKAIEHLYKLKAHILYPPARVEPYLGRIISQKDKDPNTVITIARISPEKQLENTIKLASMLPEKYRVIICGGLSDEPREKKYFNQLHELISKLKLENRVTILTNVRVDELASLLMRSSIYFHPTQSEHFGLAPIEALAAKTLPIVPLNSGIGEALPKYLTYTNLYDAVRKILIYSNKAVEIASKLRKLTSYFTYDAFKLRFSKIINTLTP